MASKAEIRNYLCFKHLKSDIKEFKINNHIEHDIDIKEVESFKWMLAAIPYYYIRYRYNHILFVYNSRTKITTFDINNSEISIHDLCEVEIDILRIEQFFNSYDFSQF